MRVSRLIDIPAGIYSVQSLVEKAIELQLYSGSKIRVGYAHIIRSEIKGSKIRVKRGKGVMVCSEWNVRKIINNAKPKFNEDGTQFTGETWTVPLYNWTVVKNKGFMIYIYK
jgi:hypothetical protein